MSVTLMTSEPDRSGTERSEFHLILREFEVLHRPRMSGAGTLPHHRITVTEFGRMVDAGVFHPEARLELIDGKVLEKPLANPPHAYAVAELTRQLILVLNDQAYVHPEGDAVLDDYSQPIPDVTIAPLPGKQWSRRHPVGPELLLAVEVGDSTIRLDRGVKLPIFARTGVAETWIVDINKRVIDVFTKPTDEGYTSTERFEPGQVVTPGAFPDVQIPVEDLLPNPDADNDPLSDVPGDLSSIPGDDE